MAGFNSIRYTDAGLQWVYFFSFIENLLFKFSASMVPSPLLGDGFEGRMRGD
jgi:hypothetical protein